MFAHFELKDYVVMSSGSDKYRGCHMIWRAWNLTEDTAKLWALEVGGYIFFATIIAGWTRNLCFCPYVLLNLMPPAGKIPCESGPSRNYFADTSTT
jgi:hypothetical protein